MNAGVKSRRIKRGIVIVSFLVINFIIFNEYLWSRLYQRILHRRKKYEKMKYILQWTTKLPFPWMSKQDAFITRNCRIINCYITTNQFYLGDITKFDVVLFDGYELSRNKTLHLPNKRSRHQKYVFFIRESSMNNPICEINFNSFFNWTWTNKLDSDFSFGYITIKDRYNTVIGPKRDMQWIDIDQMKPINKTLKEKLQSKYKAVAWFVSNCESKNRRKIADELQDSLKQYDLSIDIYGKCGKLKCDRDNVNCSRLIERDYYFYLAFENSFSDDYVTEKILHGLRNYAVPIVYGSANYTRFMPDGIYLDVRKLGIKALVEEMNDIIHDKERYYKMFRWHNHYSYHRPEDSPDTDYFCQFCARINDEHVMRKTTVVKNFHQWWNEGRCKTQNSTKYIS